MRRSESKAGLARTGGLAGAECEVSAVQKCMKQNNARCPQASQGAGDAGAAEGKDGWMWRELLAPRWLVQTGGLQRDAEGVQTQEGAMGTAAQRSPDMHTSFHSTLMAITASDGGAVQWRRQQRRLGRDQGMTENQEGFFINPLCFASIRSA